ncbi:MAG: hypothetical protein JO316_15505 [Abitibacteriaceae bacterium]|nr:hypothetical protein [Abditibacteriaceae bacterium]MBV9866760.1 hypothetical protein [Abditibacteriaceae bacterium]
MQRVAIVVGVVLLSGWAKVEAANNIASGPTQAPPVPTTKGNALKATTHKAPAAKPKKANPPAAGAANPAVPKGRVKSTVTATITQRSRLGNSSPITPQSPPANPARLQGTPQHSLQPGERALPVLVGWNDEMNDAGAWQQATTANPVDVFGTHPGLLSLRLPHVAQNFPYSYQWSGLQRDITVDLAHYPVAIARISQLQEGSYAQIRIVEHDYTGHEVQTWTTQALTSPGLAILDIGKEWGVADTRRFTLQMIVGGPLYGASCDYDWVRFVNREEVPFLQAHPNWQQVELRP